MDGHLLVGAVCFDEAASRLGESKVEPKVDIAPLGMERALESVQLGSYALSLPVHITDTLQVVCPYHLSR